LDGRLAAFKIPRYWMVADRFPRTASERVERRALIQKIVAGGAVYDRVSSTVVPNPFTRDKGVL
jgi:crotonobetaine/carnitine-CoA ligase